MTKTSKIIKINFSTIKKASLIFLVSLAISCSNTNEFDQYDEKSTITGAKTTSCDNSFPDLGPSASSSQTCSDVSNPNNKGVLDCRTIASYGGYRNVGPWGEYKIKGGNERYDGTKTRVERFFDQLTRGKNKKTVLTGIIRIPDLSSGNTCIIQSHAGGMIVEGLEQNSINRSAQFLVYAMRSGNFIRIETHRTDNPYTTDSGGGRDTSFFKTLNFSQDYTFRYETGYNSSNIAYSKLRIGGTEKTFIHNHTTERVYTRYGAYGTGDTGDITAHVRFKNINHCR